MNTSLPFQVSLVYNNPRRQYAINRSRDDFASGVVKGAALWARCSQQLDVANVTATVEGQRTFIENNRQRKQVDIIVHDKTGIVQRMSIFMPAGIHVDLSTRQNKNVQDGNICVPLFFSGPSRKNEGCIAFAFYSPNYTLIAHKEFPIYSKPTTFKDNARFRGRLTPYDRPVRASSEEPLADSRLLQVKTEEQFAVVDPDELAYGEVTGLDGMIAQAAPAPVPGQSAPTDLDEVAIALTALAGMNGVSFGYIPQQNMFCVGPMPTLD